MKNIRIGIPRALLYYRYSQSWKALFEKLGYEIICSPETTAGILKDGVKRSISDLCLPVKTFLGHVESLKDSVDYLFIPRYVSVEQHAYMCPKIIGLPDMVKACFTNLPKIIDPMVNVKKDGERASAKFLNQIAEILDVPIKKFKFFFTSNFNPALGLSCQEPTANLSFTETEKMQSDEKINIGLTGRPYLLFDKYLGKNLFKSLLKLGVNPIYIYPSEDKIKEAMGAIPKWVYWSMGKEVVTAAYSFFKNDKIHGVINMCSAACGPDSFIEELIRKKLNVNNKPYMTLGIDEHTSDVGIHTRLEAFTDMLRRVSV